MNKDAWPERLSGNSFPGLPRICAIKNGHRRFPLRGDSAGRYDEAMRKTLLFSIASMVLAPLSMAAAEPIRVIVLPFSDGATHENDSICAGVQSSLVADLPHASAATSASGLEQSADAARAARSAGAQYVVMGQLQRIDSQVRLTAQLFDAGGQPIGAAKESGDLHELFTLEDKLAFDLRDSIRSVVQSHRANTPMPTVASIGPLKFAPQPLLPVGTVPVSYTNQRLRDGAERNIYNTPYYEYDGFGFGCGGFGGGLGCFGGFGGFGFGGGGVGFATGGTGQGAY